MHKFRHFLQSHRSLTNGNAMATDCILPQRQASDSAQLFRAIPTAVTHCRNKPSQRKHSQTKGLRANSTLFATTNRTQFCFVLFSNYSALFTRAYHSWNTRVPLNDAQAIADSRFHMNSRISHDSFKVTAYEYESQGATATLNAPHSR